jgi:hypothetical protein
MGAEVVERAEPEPEARAFGEPDFERLRQFVITRRGQDVLLYAGLVAALHQVSGGCFAIETHLEQLPSAENGQVAVCSARVRVLDADRPGVARRSATGIGDASPEDVSTQLLHSTIGTAETRAKARALRDLLGVSMVTVEELGLGGAEDTTARPPASTSAPFTPPERIMVGGKAYERPQVLATYKRRLTEAQQAGMAIPPRDILPDDAPLPRLVEASQELKRRLEARNGTGQ